MELIKPGRQFDFMSKRWYFIALSVSLLIASIVSFVKPGPKMGTDFKGGTEVELAFKSKVDAGDVRSAVERAGFPSPDVVSVTDRDNPYRFLIRVEQVTVLTDAQKDGIKKHLCLVNDEGKAPEGCPANAQATEVHFSPGGDKITTRYDTAPDLAAIAKQMDGIEGVQTRETTGGAVVAACVPGRSICIMGSRDNKDNKVEIQLKSKGDQLLSGLRKELGADRVPEQALRVEWIGPKAGAQLRDAALKSIAIASFGIMLYIALRFDVRFAPGGIVALVHDVGIALGAMVITQREITLSTVAAMLTIAGYSMTDTVVVYDRIRENLGRHRNMSFSAVINLSISEMLGRTIITSGVTALSLVAFLVWGTGVLKDFAFAILIGIIVGTYSSIYVAAPLTEWIDRRFFGSSAVKQQKLSKTRAAKRASSVV